MGIVSVCKGVIWFLLATAAEVPPTVCPASFLAHPRFANHHLTSQVLIVLNLNGSVLLFQYVNEG